MQPPRFNPGGALLLAMLTAALVALGGGVVARLLPWWRPGPLVAASLLVAVEAALVRYRMLRGRHLAAGALPYLAGELFALAVLMRVAATLSVDLAGLPAQLQLWLRYPLAALDTRFVASFGVGLLVALAVRGGLRELAELEPGPPPPVAGGLAEETFRAENEQQVRDAITRLASGLGWGAGFTLLALTAQVVSFERFGAPALPLPPASGLAGIVYLVSAVLLYSRARLGLLRTRWARDEAAVEPAVPARWHVASLSLVLAMAGLGLLLPRSYGAGIFDAAQGLGLSVLQIVSVAAIVFTAMAMGALGLLLTIPALIVALLTGGAEESLPPLQPPPLPTPTPERLPPPGEPPVAPGVVFWLCIALLAAYALWTVLRRQEWAIAAWARVRAGLLAPLRAWLGRLWAGAAGYAHKVGEVLAERRRAAREVRERARVRPREPGPAGLVRWFYGLMLDRAQQSGIGRRRGDTPYEYGAQLRGQLPEAAEAVDELTDAYVAAAYAPRPTTPEQAGAARHLLARIRRALRRQHRG